MGARAGLPTPVLSPTLTWCPPVPACGYSQERPWPWTSTGSSCHPPAHVLWCPLLLPLDLPGRGHSPWSVLACPGPALPTPSLESGLPVVQEVPRPHRWMGTGDGGEGSEWPLPRLQLLSWPHAHLPAEDILDEMATPGAMSPSGAAISRAGNRMTGLTAGAGAPSRVGGRGASRLPAHGGASEFCRDPAPSTALPWGPFLVWGLLRGPCGRSHLVVLHACLAQVHEPAGWGRFRPGGLRGLGAQCRRPAGP